MNYLCLSFVQDQDGTAEFSVKLHYDDFSGAGSCHVDLDSFLKSALEFAKFPLPDDRSVCIQGGYFNEDMRSLKQTHVLVSANVDEGVDRPALNVLLSVPVEDGVKRSFKAELGCTIPMTYQKLTEISETMLALVKGYGDEYRIEL